MKYDETQIGWKGMLIFGAILVFSLLAHENQWGNNPIPTSILPVIIVFFGLMMLMFYKLRIKVEESVIHIIYGIGLIHIRIQPVQVEEVRIVKNPWYYGFGIRISPKGMLFNLQGVMAVEIKYLNSSNKNKRIRIGSEDCENLKRAIINQYLVQSPK